MVRLRVRVRFSKQGDLRLIGHRDLMRCLERLFRRGGLPLSFSEGFHPKPRMSFPLALAVGIEGDDEVMELELAETTTAAGKGDSPHLPERPEGCFAQMGTVPFSGAELLRRLAPHAPPGLAFRVVEVLPEGSKKASVRSITYEAPIPAPEQAGVCERIERLLAAASWPIERGRGRAAIDLRPLLSELAFDRGVLKMRLRIDSRGSVGPREVLAALGLTGIERQGSHLRRTGVEISA
ncbi:MAG: TIGR03936 family radical SAM-associated protein [Thermoguttaceae bacterium]